MVPKASFRGVCLLPQSITDLNIELAPLPQKVILPLGYDLDRVCDPVVEVGDRVKTGQLLGESGDFRVAPVHASVSGQVTDIRPWVDPRGNEVLSVIIASDGEDSWEEESKADEHFLEKEPHQITANLKNSGIVESDLVTVPLHAKFGKPEPSKEFLFLVGIPQAKPVDTVIINGIDAEPGMAAKRGVLETQESEIIDGIKIVQKLMEAAKIVLAVSGSRPLSPTIISSLTELGVQIFQGKDKYPQGLNPILVKCVTGREIPLPDGDAEDVGVIVVDAVNLVHLVEAVREMKPQVDKVVSISGSGMKGVKNLRVRLGTPVKDLLEQVGGVGTEPVKVIAGGAMTGQALLNLEIPVTQETNALIFHSAADAVSFSSEACINCGMCVRHCPVQLLPCELSKYCEFGLFEEARDKFLLHCIECGICAYVCPEKRPMLHLMRFGKRELSLS
jgi:electron transport complex protein RnfC